MIDDLTDEAQDLEGLMSEISEDCWCAGWYSGNEFRLWRACLEGPTNYGQGEITQRHIDRLLKLSERCGGWIIFHHETEETFVPIERWKEMYAEQVALNRLLK